MDYSKEAALKWWNAKSFEEKWYVIIQYKKSIVNYPHVSPDDLTEKEIHLLYAMTKL